MMKKIALLLLVLFATPVQAGVSCSLPFNLQNGTTADATQVMANYNALVTCLGNAAAAGANNDITSLSALSTPITPAQGGTPVYVGGTSTGTANAQTVASVVPSGFTLATGNQVTFQAGFTNTAAMTINVASTGAKNIFRRSQLGATAMVGGEIVVGQIVTVLYDGTQFQLMSGAPALIGEGKEWFTTTAPPGWFFRDGTSLARASYPDLFAVIGTTYGAVDGASFSLPDERGRNSIMKDSAGRITAQCAAANTLGTGCGNTSGQATVGQTNLPAVSLPSSSLAILNTTTSGDNSVSGVASATPGAGNQFMTASSGIAGGGQSLSITGTVPLGGGNTPLPTLDPGLIVNKIIKY